MEHKIWPQEKSLRLARSLYPEREENKAGARESHAPAKKRRSPEGRASQSSAAADCDETHRIGGTPAALCHLHCGRDVCFVRVEVSDRRVSVGRGIENAVVVEIPSIPGVGLRRLQGGRQRHIDIVAALAGLTLNAGGQSYSWGSESAWCCHRYQNEA
jgi:hypothetical protein